MLVVLLQSQRALFRPRRSDAYIHEPGRRTFRVCFAAPTHSDYEPGLDCVVSLAKEDGYERNHRRRRRWPVQLARVLVYSLFCFWLFDAWSLLYRFCDCWHKRSGRDRIADEDYSRHRRRRCDSQGEFAFVAYDGSADSSHCRRPERPRAGRPAVA